MKPRLVIASSVAGLPICHAIEEQLAESARVSVWAPASVGFTADVVSALAVSLEQADVVAYVLMADNHAGSGHALPLNPNVAFELGLIMGKVGRGRVCIVMPRDQKLPTDLDGVTVAVFDVNLARDNPRAVAGPVASLLSGMLTAASPGGVTQYAREEMTTVVFCDVVTSTTIAHQLGNAAWFGAVEGTKRRVAALGREFGGEVVKFFGDGALVAFGSPIEAVRFAVELQASLVRQPIAAGEEVATMRVSVHTAPLLRGETNHGTDLFGTGVNVAARLLAFAKPGEVVISDFTRRLLPPEKLPPFRESSRASIRGFADPVTVWIHEPLVHAQG